MALCWVAEPDHGIAIHERGTSGTFTLKWSTWSTLEINEEIRRHADHSNFDPAFHPPKLSVAVRLLIITPNHVLDFISIQLGVVNGQWILRTSDCRRDHVVSFSYRIDKLRTRLGQFNVPDSYLLLC